VLESKNIVFYNRHVDGTLVMFDNQKIAAEEILNYLHKINRLLKCKLTYEENEKISFLDLLITRKKTK